MGRDADDDGGHSHKHIVIPSSLILSQRTAL